MQQMKTHIKGGKVRPLSLASKGRSLGATYPKTYNPRRWERLGEGLDEPWRSGERCREERRGGEG